MACREPGRGGGHACPSHDSTASLCSHRLVIVDDDTFVFHRNLASNLALMDSSTPIYTGDVIPESWLPVDRDGSGNVSSAQPALAPVAWKKVGAALPGPTQHERTPRGRSSACRQTRSS